MIRKVLLIPGFSATDLAILRTGEQVWFDTRIAAVLSLGAMRLAPNGVDPQPPEGEALGHIPDPAQAPWPNVATLLRSQLDVASWSVQVLSYDWRFDVNTPATALAHDIRDTISSDNPVTLVGHSMGGLVALMAYRQLASSGDSDKVRRLITIGTPFGGSYGITAWLTGINPTVAQLVNYGQAVQLVVGFNPAQWTVDFLCGIALTWPSFYQLMPSLLAPDAIIDPHRALLYDARDYAPGAVPSQPWLDFARDVWQPQVKSAQSLPPFWVLTTVAAQGINTPFALRVAGFPLQLTNLETTQDGDGQVTVTSATIGTGKNVYVTGEHGSLPLALASSGLLAELITDPRGPLTPPSPPIIDRNPIGQNVTAPPESDYLSGLVCIGGG